MTSHRSNILLSTLIAFASATTANAAPTAGFSDKLAPFVREHCVRCHGQGERKADLALHQLTGDLKGNERLIWLSVLEQLTTGEMPPKKESRPVPAQMDAAITWLRAGLDVPAPVAGEKPEAPRTPREGNLVPHELLFGDGAAPASGVAGSPARLWRLRPEAYMGLVREVFRGRVDNLTQPFGVTGEPGFKDYADLYFVDQATTEILVRNAEQIVEGQTAHTVSEGKLAWKNDTVREFKPLFETDEPTREQLVTAIQQQYKLAVVRDPTADEVTALLGLYDRCRQSADRTGAARTMLSAVLLRPEAIFRMETAAGTSVVMLPPRELARAISLAIGDRRDGALFAAAEKGQLTTRQQVTTHVRRMLDDPKAENPRLLRFVREYFGYDMAVDIFKDNPRDLKHTPQILVDDTDRLVKHILAADKDVLVELLTTTRTFANYGEKEDKATRKKVAVPRDIPNIHNDPGRAGAHGAYNFAEWPALQPAELPKEQRAGILTQPAWLVAHSTNFDNDPVRRGRWVRERLLGGHVPQLPIGVAAQVPDEPQRTLRDRLQVTRAAECWQCHRKMDDLGLAFERFDHYGRYRTTETVLDPAATAANVDKKGKALGPVTREAPLNALGIVTGSGDPALDGPVSDAVELANKLAKSDRVRQVFVRHAFRFFLGRNETPYDAATLQDADRAYVESGGSFKTLVVSLVSSDAFLYRVPSAIVADQRLDRPRTHGVAPATKGASR